MTAAATAVLPARAPDGESMARVRDRFCAWLYGPDGPGPTDAKEARAIGALFARRVSGDEPTPDEWDRAARAARAAWADWADRAAWADWAAWADRAAWAARAARAAWADWADRADWAAWAAQGLAALLGDRLAIPKLDTRLLRRVGGGSRAKGVLEMRTWHACKTTHCRAGWYVTLRGKLGAELEGHFGSWLAGAAIYLASHPGETTVPDFFASNDDALTSIRESAAREVSP